MMASLDRDFFGGGFGGGLFGRGLGGLSSFFDDDFFGGRGFGNFPEFPRGSGARGGGADTQYFSQEARAPACLPARL